VCYCPHILERIEKWFRVEIQLLISKGRLTLLLRNITATKNNLKLCIVVVPLEQLG
jgi:hypothetical protein